MKHKAAELEGALLDAAVAMARGDTWATPSRYSTLWDLGGPLIESERIATWISEAWEDEDHMASRPAWRALHPQTNGQGYYRGGAIDVKMWDGIAGPTMLIAAMRAYVESKFGEEVELP